MSDKEIYIESCMEMGMTKSYAIQKWKLKQLLEN